MQFAWPHTFDRDRDNEAIQNNCEQGVALAYGQLVRRYLAEGRLLKPFDVTSGSFLIYSQACPERRFDEPLTAALRDGIIAESLADESAHEGLRWARAA